MDETEDEINNYRILRRIGFTHTDMTKGLALKILFNFGLPLIIALLHALFVAMVFMKLMGEYSPIPIIIVMIVYSLVYLIFAKNLIYPCKSNCKTLYLIIEKKGRCLNEY